MKWIHNQHRVQRSDTLHVKWSQLDLPPHFPVSSSRVRQSPRVYSHCGRGQISRQSCKTAHWNWNVIFNHKWLIFDTHLFFGGGGELGFFWRGGGVRAKVKKCRIVWYWVITVFGLKDVKWKKFSGLNDLMEKERLKSW